MGLEGASSEYLCISILELETASDIRHYVVEEEEESPGWWEADIWPALTPHLIPLVKGDTVQVSVYLYTTN